MIDVKVIFQVRKNGGESTSETMYLKVDSSTLSMASGQSSKGNLDGWAKQFFPNSVSAHVVRMEIVPKEKEVKEIVYKEKEVSKSKGNSSLLFKIITFPIKAVWAIIKFVLKDYFK